MHIHPSLHLDSYSVYYWDYTLGVCENGLSFLDLLLSWSCTHGCFASRQSISLPSTPQSDDTPQGQEAAAKKVEGNTQDGDTSDAEEKATHACCAQFAR